MILARDVFQVKFGQMDAVLAALKAAEERYSGQLPEFRVLTDISGSLFTLVMESKAESVDAHRERMLASFNDPEIAATMGQMMQHMESGHREYYNIEYEFGG